MSRIKLTLLMAGLLANGSAPALADEVRSVPSGVNRQIDFLASINPDCSSIGLATVRLIEGPAHGVLTTDKGRDYKPFAAPNPRHACNGRRVAGLKVFYQSESGFFGTDRIHILIVAASGTEREETYEIRVR
jgi:hypothetical protein